MNNQTQCWVLLADNIPVGAFLYYEKAVVERSRLSKEQKQDRARMTFTLAGPVTLTMTLSGGPVA